MSHVIVPVAFPASAFATESSKALKLGDCIVTRPAIVKRPKKNKFSQLQSALPLDTSSEKALWQTLNPSASTAAEDELKAKIVSMGTVTAIDRGKSRVTVSIWRRGDEYYVDQRPVASFFLNEVMNISRSQFFKECKRPFMERKERQLQLKGEGDDDDTPISLMAYNNRIISELLERTHNKKAKVLDDPLSGIREELHKVTMETGTAYGKRKLKKSETQETLSSAPDKSKYGIDSSAKATSEAAPLSFLITDCPLSTENIVSRSRPSSKMGRLLASLTGATGGELSTDLVLRKDRLHSSMQVDGMLTCGRLGMRSPTLEESRPRSMSNAIKKLNLSCATLSSQASPSTDSSLDQRVQSLTHISLGSNSKPTISSQTYTVLEVFERGKFLLSHESGASLNVPAARFLATFEGLVVPHSADLAGSGCSPVRFLDDLLKNQVIEAVHYGHDSRGVIKLDVTLGSAWVPGLLVDAGMARCAFSHLDPESWMPNISEKSFNDISHFNRLDEVSCRNLLQRQRGAVAQRVGMWSLPAALSNFVSDQPASVSNSNLTNTTTPSNQPPLSGRPRSSSVHTMSKPDMEPLLPSLLLDRNGMDEPMLSSLFDACETSEIFRQRLEYIRSKAASSSSFRISQPGTPMSG